MILIAGGGMMGRAIAKYLSNIYDVVICDMDEDKARYSAEFACCDYIHCDMRNTKKMKEIMSKFDVVVSALPYSFNIEMTKVAIQSKTDMCDLGGNIDIVLRQIEMDNIAKKRGVSIIPDCGLAPGLGNILAYDVAMKAGKGCSIKIRCGGIPLKPEPPLWYALFFSVKGLINEYKEDCIVVRNWKVKKLPSLTEVESINFEGFTELEAFLTSGGTSTLPITLKNFVRDLDYKTIRYKGHCTVMKAFSDLGFFNDDVRQITENLFEKNLKKNVRDIVLMRVEGKGREKVIYEFTSKGYKDMSAMQRCTCYPTSIIASMLHDNIIEKKGVLFQEEHVPFDEFMAKVRKRIKICTKIL